MMSNLRQIAAWVECNTPATDFDAVADGIRLWGKCKAVSGIIVATEPGKGKEEMFVDATAACEEAGKTLIPGLKLSPALRGVFDNYMGWCDFADSVVLTCQHAKSSIVVVEGESAAKGYVEGAEEDVNLAKVARGLRQLPAGITVLWYPALTYINYEKWAPQHNRQLAIMRLLLSEHLRSSFIDTSIGMPSGYWDQRVRANEAALRALFAEFHRGGGWTSYRKLWCMGGKYWRYDQIPRLVADAIRGNDVAILWPGFANWSEAAEEIGARLNLLD